MNRKRNAGLSYIEVIIALAIFAVTALVVFFTISQATRNLYIAETYYIAPRHATGIMMAVRDAANVGGSVDTTALALAANTTATHFGVEHFTVWINGVYLVGEQWGSVGVTETSAPNIVVVIWNADEQIIGRSVGLI